MSQLLAPTIGERIRAARQRAGLSHDRLGELVGTSRRHLIRLEQNVNRPKPEMLAKIASATSSTVEELTPSDDDEESDPDADLVKAIRRIACDELERRMTRRLVRAETGEAA